MLVRGARGRVAAPLRTAGAVPRHTECAGAAAPLGAAVAHRLRAGAPPAAFTGQCRRMGTVKEMMVRAALSHVAATMTADDGGRAAGAAAVGATGDVDVDDVETWRAIVVRG